MKNHFFIILCLFTCSTWNQSLEGITEERKKAIIEAIRNNNPSTIKDNEINVNLGDKQYQSSQNATITIKNATPLTWAVYTANKIPIVKFLINNNANLFEKISIMVSNVNNNSPKEYLLFDMLISSLRDYHQEIVDWFIRNNKAISEYRNKDGNTLLHLFAESWIYLESFKKLYENNLDIKNLEAINNYGQTPLHIALEKPKITSNGIIKAEDIARYIIEETNIDLTKQYSIKMQYEKEKKEFIFYKIWDSSQSLRKSACNNIKKSNNADKPLDHNNNTLIHYLAENDTYKSILTEVLTHNKKINKENIYGKTALHVAFDKQTSFKPNNKEAIIELIKSNQFDLTKIYHTKPSKNMTLFEYILSIKDKINNDNFDVFIFSAIESIIAQNKISESLDSSGLTIFHFLVENESLFNNFISSQDNIALFQANINIKDKNNKTPLLKNPIVSTLKQLIEWGADINAIDNNGNTILHYCTATELFHVMNKSNLEKLEYLLENPAIKKLINNKNKENKTPFDLVIDCIIKNPRMYQLYEKQIDLLIKYGAEIGNTISRLDDEKNKCHPLAKNDLEAIRNFIATLKPNEPKPGPTSDALSQQLSKLNMELTNLRKKLKLCAKNLNTLKNKLGVK